MNWLDWLIIAILAFSAFQGLRYGLVASVAKLAGILIGFGVAITYYRELAAYLTVQWNMEEKILPLAEKFLMFWFPAKNSIPPSLTPDKFTSAGELVPSQLFPFSNYADYVSGMFASVILNALCFLALLLSVVWVVNFAGYILSRIADIGFLGPFNRLGGFLFGAAKGLVVVMIVLTLISPFQRLDSLPGGRSEIPDAPSTSRNSFSGSKLLPYFEPLFNAINQPLPGLTPEKIDMSVPVKTV